MRTLRNVISGCRPPAPARTQWMAWMLATGFTVLAGTLSVQALTISGRVTSGGTGISNVNVHVVCGHTDYDENFTTDANGYYTATGVQTHNLGIYAHHHYIATFSKAGYTFSPPNIDVEVPTDSGNIVGQDATVAAGPGTGQITSGGIGLPGVTVSQVQADGHLAEWETLLALPDGNATGLSIPLVIGTKGAITCVNLKLWINHQRYLDLIIKLRHPDGTEMVLADRNWDTSGRAGWSWYRHTFDGKQANGTYTLIIADAAASYTGSLEAAYLYLNSSTTTDNNGNYDLGTIMVQAQVTPSKTDVTFSPSVRTNYAGVPGNFTATGPIHGYVRSGSSHGVSGVTVTKGSSTRTTDANGFYDFGNGSAGTVSVAKTSHSFSPASQTVFPGSDGNFTVSTGPITGRARSGTTYLSGVTITATRTGQTTQTATTDSSGNYSFSSLNGSADWTITPSKSGLTFTPASSTSFAGATGVVFVVASGSISGQITANGVGVNGVTVTAAASGQSTRSTTTDASGNYSFTGLNGDPNWTVTPSRTGLTFSPANSVTYAGASGIGFLVTQSPPTISDVANLTMSEDSITNLNVTVNDWQTALSSLNLTASSDNSSLLPTNRITLGGSGGTRTVTLYPLPNATGSVSITLTVKDANNQTASDSFTVTVANLNDPPVVGSGPALRFDGADDYVSIPAWAIPTNEITVEFWQKADEARQQATFTAVVDVNANRFNAHVPWSDGKVYWDFGDVSNGGRISYTPPISVVGAWHHWALVSSKAGNFMCIYRNGVLEASNSVASARTGTQALNIGYSGTRFFKGDLGEFRIWNVARNADEIRTNLNRMVPTNSPNLMVYYRFAEGASSSVRDLASLSSTGTNQLGSQNGTLSGSPAWLASVIDGPPKESRFIVGENESVAIVLPAYDIEKTPAQLLFTNVVVTTGAVTHVAGLGASNVTFTAPAIYTGPALLHYQVSDGSVFINGVINLFCAGTNASPVLVSPANRTIERDTPSVVIPFRAWDRETPGPSLVVYATVSDPSVATIDLGEGVANPVSDTTGTNWTLTVLPQLGAIGAVQITLTVQDEYQVETSASFEILIVPPPAFEVVDLGLLPGKSVSFGRGINDQGAVVGFAADNNNEQNAEPFLFNGLENGGQFSSLGRFLSGGATRALAINGQFSVVGSGTTNNQLRAFFKSAEDDLMPLGLIANTSNSVATAVSSAGATAGYAISNNLSVPFLVPPYGTVSSSLGALSTTLNSARAFALNATNLVVGVASNQTDGQRRAVIWRGGSGATNLFAFPNDTNSVARAVNTFAQIAGSSTTVSNTDSALSFAAAGDYVSVPHQSALNAFPLTVMAWVKTTSSANALGVVNKYLAASQNGYQIYLNGGRVRAWYFRGVSGSYVQESPLGLDGGVVNDGNWHHVAFTVDATGGYLCVDGVLKATRAWSGSAGACTTARALEIGRYPSGGGTTFNGQIDEVQIWNVAKSSNEIVTARFRRPSSSEPGLVAYFPFDEGSGNATADLGPNHFAGTLQSGPTWATRVVLETGSERAFVYDTVASTLTCLGTLPLGVSSDARSINDFGQVAGIALDSNGTARAFFHSAGKLYNLNELISEQRARDWTLDAACGINRSGAIVGTGRSNGLTRAFLALPATVIGQPVARPLGAVERMPEITILRKHLPDDSSLNSFLWSEADRRLYAIRPVIAKLAWFTTFADTTGTGTNITAITERVTTVTANVWPKHPTIHIAGAPVEVQPAGVTLAHSYQSFLYVTNGASVEPNAKVFTCTNSGYSVLYYLKTDGRSPNPQTQSPYFEVVRTVPWDDSHAGITTVNWTIGDEVIDSAHADYGGKNGYVLWEISPYDGSGPDRAYSRAARLGPILPVNNQQDPLLVVWYRTNRIGVAWASVPIQYSLTWPTNAPHLVIASTLGSGELNTVDYPEKKVYNQPNPALPGFNPNEEHALITSDTLYALRNDLNTINNLSEPFVLLKYRDRITDRWQMRVFEVVAEQAPEYVFRYTVPVAREIQPPMPLSVLPLCQDSGIVSGPGWEDVYGKIYARAAGRDGSDTNLVLRWYYPLQPGFYYPDTNIVAGSCIAWLDRHPAGELVAPNTGQGVSGVSIDVTYDVRWEIHDVLQIGESVLHQKAGLPDLFAMRKAEIIYDDLSPDDPASILALARFYDPISTRTLASGVNIPTALLDPTKTHLSAGKVYFNDLPWQLQVRLSYDPLNGWLSFSGYLDESFAGEPLLLPNVLSGRERDDLKALASSLPASDQSTWGALMDRLFDLTRNPNGVDVDPEDGWPDQALRIGLTTAMINRTPTVVLEQFGAGPKALTAGLGGVPPAEAKPGHALNFDGANDYVSLGPSTQQGDLNLQGTDFTIEFWAKRTTATGDRCIFGQAGGPAAFGQLRLGFRSAGQFAFDLGTSAGSVFTTTATYSDTDWHHWACSFDQNRREQIIYRDGAEVARRTATNDYVGTGVAELGRFASGSYFSGRLDEFRVWTSVRSAADIRGQMNKRLLGCETDLTVYYRFDEGSGSDAVNAADGGGYTGDLNGVTWVTSTAPCGIPPRYITVAENNDTALAGAPVNLYVIRIDDGPFRGDLKALPGENVFDQRLTIRHSSDFGGDPGPLTFQWFYKPIGADFDPTDLPVVTDPAADQPSEMRGWILYSNIRPISGAGVNYVTIGEGGESGLITISDNAFICRYRGYAVNLAGPTNWSGWVGDPSGTPDEPRPVLAEGWVKRVIRGLNVFDARSSDFHSTPASTFSSMLVQAGPRYEGPIAFNPDPSYLNSLGIIEAYQTVLERAKGLSIEGAPAVDFNPANNALLMAATKLSDLYMLLGNEAYADAQDPSIGFGTDSVEYGSAASSIFAFQNQLDSLLEEELVLLRGRDDSAAGVAASPAYNRLYWNFTLGEGEIAYQQVYDISDQNRDGFIDERDARILYPQGHGDAWGHYLTAIKQHYTMLRHPYFTWIPRTELVNVSGVAVEVDFLDERKFAATAAAKARTGAEIVDLTYRSHYVEDPAGQWQGYKDTDEDRAWGVTEWARRAGQAAYFDWVVGNTILPATDPNTNHVGIQKIDRTTVRELHEVAAHYLEIQGKLDQADVGLNPLGLARGVVPFDIDPSLIAAGQTHYEQIQGRALDALNNASAVWDQVNKATEQLRRNQDSQEEFTKNVIDQERDYKNRLIEIFGYPYAGDIGAGKTYPSGYDGPDLYHYMYIPTKEITDETAPPSTNFSAFYTTLQTGYSDFGFVFPDGIVPTGTLSSNVLEVSYPFSVSGYGFVPPSSWGQRRAPGELQMALNELVQAEARLKQALENYNKNIQLIQEEWQVYNEGYWAENEALGIVQKKFDQLTGIGAAILAAQETQLVLNRITSLIDDTTDVTTESLPKVLGLANDATAPIRGGIKAISLGLNEALKITSDVAAGVGNALSYGKDIAANQAELDLAENTMLGSVYEQLREILKYMREEAPLRLEVFTQREAVVQAGNRYLAALAQGQRLIEERIVYRKRVSAETTEQRYRDMAFRIFRNDALQKYRASFDLAARYVFLAATAYDYEVNLLGSDTQAGQSFLTDIIRQRSLGQILEVSGGAGVYGVPVAGTPGLADPLARMGQNFAVLKGQLGFNNPETETGRFSLRREKFRLLDTSDAAWRAELKKCLVADLWQVPEFRRYCRPFAPESAGPQPGLVIRFPTTVTFGLNFFGWPLAGGDSAYDSSRFSTRVRSVGVWFTGYNGAGLSLTPRVYLVPAGLDILRSPSPDDFVTRDWRVVDQALPVPFPIGANALNDPSWIPMNNSLGGTFAEIRRFASFRAFHDAGFDTSEMTSDSRLIGRSVWNTDWIIIIPGGTLLSDPAAGLDVFINSVTDIKLFFQTYSYPGN
ncbi:MAG: proprotein convertase P-domain-containing protein [Verrucomicrobia bacterium]|nr:proprotein convertase P-domain-containing protein [Verrucomicrobiota bacterium]